VAYSDDISTLGADHHWDFDGDSLDQIGSIDGTDTTMDYTHSAIAKDATFCATIDARSDKVLLSTATTIENAANARKAVGGWFAVDSVELPMCVIYSEGTYLIGCHMYLMPGNSVVAEIRDGANFQVQVYSDMILAPDRSYHLCLIFEGTGYANEVRFYIDGISQLDADPSDRQPDVATITARAQVGVFGDPTHTDVGMGGTDFADDIQSPGDNRSTEQVIDAYYQHWCCWGDEADAVLTTTEVRETLFERGALADVTISTGTESAMQTALDVYADTVRGNAACCIEVEAVSGGGDFTLDLDNITFNSLASIHIRYNGTADTLTLINKNGANCSIVANPFGGSTQVFTEVDIDVAILDITDSAGIDDARVLVEADSGGALPSDDVVTITRSVRTATVSHTAHGLSTGDYIGIRNANQGDYNGIKQITVTTVDAYTYSASSNTPSPATGTITATAVLLNDITDSNGDATNTFLYSADQPVRGLARKGSSSPYHKTGAFASTITSSGVSITVLLTGDE